MAIGRPIQSGLSYFRLDTSPGDKIKYLKKKCGMDGYGIFVTILERIYKFEGYYCKWDEMAQVLFCDDGIEINRLREVVNCCFDVGLFHRDIYTKYYVLTSAEIQRRYMGIIHQCKRKGIKILPKYDLISSEESGISSEESVVSSELNGLSSEEIPNDSDESKKKGRKMAVKQR